MVFELLSGESEAPVTTLTLEPNKRFKLKLRAHLSGVLSGLPPDGRPLLLGMLRVRSIGGCVRRVRVRG